MTISPLGDSAVIVQLGETVDETLAARVLAVATEIDRHPFAGMVEVVPAFTSVAIFFDPVRAPRFAEIQRDITTCVNRAEAVIVSQTARVIEVPVCYGGEFGPDLPAVAEHTRLSVAEVIAQHSRGDYLVHAIGFIPGFPYLGGLPSSLATPRRPTPRPRVVAGSVGIGGSQTGVYPFETPGGWNLIGRTPLRLFDVNREEPALLRAGDRVKFQPITAEEFNGWPQPLPVTSAVRTGDINIVGGAHIEVLRAGLLTTIQDLGRRGHRAKGVPLSGAADPTALRLVNALVGNPEDAAALEFTLIGPELKFSHDTVVALGGADFAGLPRWRPMTISAGTVIKFSAALTGCRGYLAIAGGVAVPQVMGSRSTYGRAALGGLVGRPLRNGDVLPIPSVVRHIKDHWRIDERILPPYSNSPVVRVTDGAQRGDFGDAWLAQSYRASSHSDRMGTRLTGQPLMPQQRRELISSPVVPGTIQVPADGQPIILLADAQTIGGYPQLAHVVSVDVPLVAQLRPGDAVKFRVVSLDHARELNLAQDRAIALLREGLAHKLA